MIFFIHDSHGSLTGSGIASVGISKLQDETEVGADLTYELESNSSYHETEVSIFTEYTSSKSGVQLFNDHRRLYDTDLTMISVDNRIPMVSSLMNWNTESNFESKELTLTSDRSEDWYWATGPEIKKYVRRDIFFETITRYGKSKLNDQLSTNKETEFSIGKNLSSNKTLKIGYSYLCWDFENIKAMDNCNIIHDFTLDYKTRNSLINLSIGESIIDDTKSTVYGMNINYNINSKDKLILNAKKENGNLKSRLDFSTIDNLDPVSIEIDTKRIEYIKKLSRTSFSFYYEKSKFTSDQISSMTEKVNNIEIKYLLSGSLCYGCSLIISNKVNDRNGLDWRLLTAGIEYPISRNTRIYLTIRHSNDEIFGAYNSLNFQIKYNGMDQRLSFN
jgi:hypothetical protein